MFDPNGAGVANGAYFGFEFTADNSNVSLLSVPFDATVSYRGGSAGAPSAILDASTQVEIYDADFVDAWKSGIYTMPFDGSIVTQSDNDKARIEALKVITHLEAGGSVTDDKIQPSLAIVNSISEMVHNNVYTAASKELKAGRAVGIVGGDHSAPLGLLWALSEEYDDFGILHIDAHADLRKAYEGFTFSHASIMFNVHNVKCLSRITQVGIRDFCAAEVKYASGSLKLLQYPASELYSNEFNGITWDTQCSEIIASLPRNVYISFDIDGLDRAFCPSTGTPVPGGLSYQKAIYLLTKLSAARTVIGFDLNEVAPSPTDEWDAIVGARLLYKLSLILCQSKSSSTHL